MSFGTLVGILSILMILVGPAMLISGIAIPIYASRLNDLKAEEKKGLYKNTKEKIKKVKKYKKIAIVIFSCCVVLFLLWFGIFLVA